MYLGTTSRRAADGTLVRYLQLAHNEWDPAAHRSKVRVLYHFGREDALDRDAIRRLIGSLSRALPPGEALVAAAPPELRLTESRPLGGPGRSTACGGSSGCTRSWPGLCADAAWTLPPSGSSSRWWRTGPSNRSPSCPAPPG